MGEFETVWGQVVTVASKSGEEFVPVPGFRQVAVYEQLYPDDFKSKDDMNAEYLTSKAAIALCFVGIDVVTFGSGGKDLLPMESQCVEYAADSEDEDWLDTTMNSENQDRLSVANLEKIIWKLELANSMVTQHMLRKAGKTMSLLSRDIRIRVL